MGLVDKHNKSKIFQVSDKIIHGKEGKKSRRQPATNQIQLLS